MSRAPRDAPPSPAGAPSAARPVEGTVPAGPAADYTFVRTPITSGNRVEVLLGGAEAYPAMLAAIRGAEREVLLESYILAADGTGRAFVDALVESARGGRDVRVIVDAVGSLGLPGRWLEEIEAAGGRTLVYHPVAPWRPRWNWWRRDHRKILVVDQSIAFTGGINVADEYDDRTAAGRAWRDLALRIEGAAASVLRNLFATTWNRESPPPRRMVRRSTRTVAAVVKRDAGPTSLAPREGVAVAVLANRETRGRSVIRRAFLYALRRARRSVMLVNPYFIPDIAVTRALRHAARRGVDVRIVVPSRSDARIVDLASRHTFGGLLAAGVRIAEWQGMMHAKAAAIDGAWATVGSYNFDRQSFAFNLEVTANVLDVGIASAVEQRLRADFDAATEVLPDDYAARPLGLRLVSFLAYQLRAIL